MSLVWQFWGYDCPNLITFVSKAALENDIAAQLNLQKQVVAVSNTRQITKQDMKLNEYMPHMDVDPKAHEMRADGKWLTGEPAVLPMAQGYFLF